MIDARTIDDGRVLECDVCIVGGGVAGLTLASEFVGSGIRVLVMESGPAAGTDPDTEALRGGTNIGLPYFNPRDLTRRGLGGNSARWSSFMAPFDPIDFEYREWVPYSGWPIRFADLRDYYRKASVIGGVGEYSYDPVELGGGIGDPGYEAIEETGGLCSTRMFQFRDPPLNWSTAYRSRIEADPSIEILTYANAVSIDRDAHGRTVESIRFRTVNGKMFTVSSRRFVLAMGGIEIPRVMLASAGDHRFAVGNEHDLVGRFFMEHPHYTGYSTVLLADAGRRFPTMYTWEAIQRHGIVGMIGPTDDAQRQERILNCVTMLQNRVEPWAGAAQSDGYLAHLSAVLKDTASLATRAIRSPRTGGRLGLDAYRRPLLEYRFQYEQAPNPDSRVTLSDQLDPLGLPQIRIDWRMTELDRRSFEVGHEVVARELGRVGLGRVRLVDLKALEAWPPPYKSGKERDGPSIFGAWHTMGTTRMHDDPRQGVVNRDSRVHGIGNLYIAGPSVFTTSSFANPVMTTVALTIRLADHLKATVTDG